MIRFIVVKYLLSIALLLYVPYQSCMAQHDYQLLLDQLKNEIHEGNIKAYRDLGTLLNQAELKDKVLPILAQHSLFTKEELVLNDHTTRQDILDFYYKEADKIKFSPILNSFYWELMKWMSILKMNHLKIIFLSSWVYYQFGI